MPLLDAYEPVIRLPSAPPKVSPASATLDIAIKAGTKFYVSVSVVNTSEGATLEFRTRDDNGLDPWILGAELGTRAYIAPFDIATIDLQAGASGGTISAWLSEDEMPIERC